MLLVSFVFIFLCFILKVPILLVIANFALPADLVAQCDKHTEQRVNSILKVPF